MSCHASSWTCITATLEVLWWMNILLLATVFESPACMPIHINACSDYHKTHKTSGLQRNDYTVNSVTNVLNTHSTHISHVIKSNRVKYISQTRMSVGKLASISKLHSGCMKFDYILYSKP